MNVESIFSTFEPGRRLGDHHRIVHCVDKTESGGPATFWLGVEMWQYRQIGAWELLPKSLMVRVVRETSILPFVTLGFLYEVEKNETTRRALFMLESSIVGFSPIFVRVNDVAGYFEVFCRHNFVVPEFTAREALYAQRVVDGSITAFLEAHRLIVLLPSMQRGLTFQ